MSPGGALPLAGTRVMVTRATHQAAGLEALLAAAGAQVERLPLLEVLPPREPRHLEQAACRIHQVDWLVVTSANTVDALAAALPGPWPRGPRVAAVGSATAAALARHGVEAHLLPARPQAEGLLEELAPRLRPGDRVLLPQAADAGEELAAGLRRLPVELETVVAYEKRIPPEAAARFRAYFAQGAYGWVTFTSPSTARAFAELAAGEWERRRGGLLAASIGPVTSAALRELGVAPAAEAATPSDAALVAAICGAVRPGRA